MDVYFYVYVIHTHKSKGGYEVHDVQTIRWVEDEIATPHFVDTTCKIEKECNFSKNHLQKLFSHEGYLYITYE